MIPPHTPGFWKLLIYFLSPWICLFWTLCVNRITKDVVFSKYVVTEGDSTLGGEHTGQYRDCVLQKLTLETNILLLTNVTPIILI